LCQFTGFPDFADVVLDTAVVHNPMFKMDAKVSVKELSVKQEKPMKRKKNY
jgi:hypothetical protein